MRWALSVLLGVAVGLGWASAESCSAVLSADESSANRDKLWETAVLVSEMGDAMVDGLSSLLLEKGLDIEEPAAPEELGGSGDVEKRKHEYLRFGKRKHEYLRFGKRKHEYLRFGKRKHEYLRFGKRKHEYLRFGKRSA